LNNNYSNYPQNFLNLDKENQSAKLAVIGGVISTLGVAISTLAAVLALEEASQRENDNNDNDDNDMKDMKKQINYLTNELNKLKSSSNKKSDNRGF
jgi:hypothetical protein